MSCSIRCTAEHQVKLVTSTSCWGKKILFIGGSIWMSWPCNIGLRLLKIIRWNISNIFKAKEEWRLVDSIGWMYGNACVSAIPHCQQIAVDKVGHNIHRLFCFFWLNNEWKISAQYLLCVLKWQWHGELKAQSIHPPWKISWSKIKSCTTTTHPKSCRSNKNCWYWPKAIPSSYQTELPCRGYNSKHNLIWKSLLAVVHF